jgi:Uma2 family endonuclease
MPPRLRREHLPVLPDEAFLALAPDWVCEIASPSTERLDRGIKVDVYLREGVGHLWIRDPVAKFVEMFRRAAGQWVSAGMWSSDEPAHIEPFAAVAIDLSA